MSVSDFEVRIAKLEAKILKDVGEPIPADVRSLAAGGNAAASMDSSASPKTVPVPWEIRKIQLRSGAAQAGQRSRRKRPNADGFTGTFKPQGVNALVDLGEGKKGPAKVTRHGNELVVNFINPEAAKEALVEILADKPIKVSKKTHGGTRFTVAKKNSGNAVEVTTRASEVENGSAGRSKRFVW